MSLNTLVFCLIALFSVVYGICEGQICDPCPDGFARAQADAANCCPACDIDCKVEVSSTPCEVIDVCPTGTYLDRPYGCCDMCVQCDRASCPVVQCSDAYIPDGECCEVCPVVVDPCVDFNTTDCPPADCSDAYIPQGKCCPECPQQDPCADFNTADCPPVNCNDAYIPEGKCCKECPQQDPCADFNTADCPAVDCSDAYIPEGKCCKECPQQDPCADFDPAECNSDSSVNHENDPCWFSYASSDRPCCETWVEIDCPRVDCDEPILVEGKCCKECPRITDCENIVCGDVKCEDGSEPEIIGDECCPTCPFVDKCEDFDFTQCKTRDCYAGEKIVMKDCCPVCVRPCDTVACPDYTCADGELEFSNDEQCCADSCVPTTCSNVLCYKPECGEGEEHYIPEEECCPKCRKIEDRDCETDIQCGDIRCNAIQVEVIPFGKCCPICRARTGYQISSNNITVVVDEEKVKEILFALFGDEISISDFEIVPVGDGKYFVQFANEEQEAEFKSLVASQTIYDSILVEDIIDDSETDTASGALVFILVVAIAALF